jgi:hypothetical protein
MGLMVQVGLSGPVGGVDTDRIVETDELWGMLVRKETIGTGVTVDSISTARTVGSVGTVGNRYSWYYLYSRGCWHSLEH